MRAPQLGERRVGHPVVGVDLAVRVGDGGAHLLAPVLEHQHVGHVGPGAQGLGALGPQVDHTAGAVEPQAGERLVVLGGVEHHFATVVGQRGPAVDEGAHPVRLGRLGAAHAEGARAAGPVGAVLAGAGHNHGGAGQLVDADVGHRPSEEVQVAVSGARRPRRRALQRPRVPRGAQRTFTVSAPAAT